MWGYMLGAFMSGCYDRVYCCSRGCRNKCGRYLLKEALEVWKAEGVPVVYKRFCDEDGELLRCA